MPTKKSTGRRWGLSPRPVAEDLPEWTKDFHGPGWAATPNPQAAASKRQVKAWVLLGSVLAALPVSLLSCLIAVSSGSQTPVQPDEDRPVEWSLARSEAQLEALRWLRAGGMESSVLAWRESRESLLPCSGRARCEDHTFTARPLDDGERVLLVVTVDPATGDIAGVNVIEEPVTAGLGGRPVWSDSRREAVTDDASLENIRATIREWASAWAARDLRTLTELAGGDPDVGRETAAGGTVAGASEPRIDAFVLGDRWWVVHPPESLEILSLVDGPSQSMQLATVAFSLVRECTDGTAEDGDGPRAPRCSECSTRAATGPKRLCDGSLDMTADLWVESSWGDVHVRGSAHVGGLDPRKGPPANAGR